MGRHISHSTVTTFQGKTFWVNSKPSGIYTHMFKQMLGQLDAMLQHHSKVHLFRFDLHQPTYTEDNKRITIFLRRYRKQLIREYGFKRIGFLWARENEKVKNQHYHFVIILDGHKVQSGQKVVRIAREIWGAMGGSERTPKVRYYYNLNRHDHQPLQDAIHHVSYLAKGRGKGYRPKQTKDYGTSRIKGVRTILC